MLCLISHQPQANAPYHSQVMDSKPRLRETAGDDNKNCLQGRETKPSLHSVGPRKRKKGQKKGESNRFFHVCFILSMDYNLTISWFLLALIYIVEGRQAFEKLNKIMAFG